jgi:hypothetical protein
MWRLDDGGELVCASSDPKRSGRAHIHAAPDSSWLLVGRFDGEIGKNWILFETNAGQERARLSAFRNTDIGYTNPDYTVASATGALIAYSEFSYSPKGVERRSLVQSTASGKVVRILDDAWPLIFSAGDDLLVTGDHAQKADNTTSSRFSPEAGWVDTPPRPALQSVTIWDVQCWKKRRQIMVDRRMPVSAALSRDRRLLAVVLFAPVEEQSAADELGIWDVSTGSLVAALPFNWPKSVAIRPKVEFSPDGSLLVLASGSALRRHVWVVRDLPPRPVELPRFGRDIDVLDEGEVYPRFSPDGARLLIPAPDCCEMRPTTNPDRATRLPSGRLEFSPDGCSIAVVQAKPYADFWRPLRNWINRRLGRQFMGPPAQTSELLVLDSSTGSLIGGNLVLPYGSNLLGFAADGRSIWTMFYNRSQVSPFTYLGGNPNGEPTYEPDGTMVVQQWSLPSPRPPWWLIAVTVIGVSLIFADLCRSRRLAVHLPVRLYQQPLS